MLISRASIESVKERASLVEVAGEVVKLRRQGASMVGLCPFHSERSPSFHIRDSDKYFHCFGCGAAGNVISFVMQLRGLSFPDAVTDLAQRFGITLERNQVNRSDATQRFGDGASAAEREQLAQINALTQQFFLMSSQTSTSPTPEYLLERGVGFEALGEFGIGFAPAEFGALQRVFAERKIALDLMLKSGLVRRSERGELYDTFRSRVMFPILDERKRILGFGGRLIGAPADSRAPKYINSPETPLYEKSKIFYGLPQSLPQLRAVKEAIIVEGYFDVIGLWQAGVRRALATCGTALTEAHVKRLIHLVNRVVLLFDGDTAGVAAAGKVFPLFVNSGLDVQVVALPTGEDPDTFALRYGADTDAVLNRLVRRPLLDCYIEYLALGAAGAPAGQAPHALAPAAKGKVSAALGSVLATVRNEIERSELLERAGNILKVSSETLTRLALRSVARSKSQSDEGGGPTLGSSVLETTDSAQPVGTALPSGIERSLLSSVMTLKGVLPGKILADGALCELLSPITIEFIAAFQMILSNAELADAQRKEATRALLDGYGDAWLALWRASHARRGSAIHPNEGFDLEAVLSHARIVAKKQRIQGLITELEQAIALSGDDHEKGALAKAKVDLDRQLRQVAS